MTGRNIANANNGIERLLFSPKKEPCVFISYKSEDVEAAKEINNYLNNTGKVNTYFDINDFELKKATNKGDDMKIVESIKSGLDLCTHLLCIISDKTQVSWWVPYEIGIADKSDMDIASLKLKDIDDIPSFLKIHKPLFNINDFINYIKKIDTYGGIFENNNYQRIITQSTEALEKYIEKGD